VALLIACTVLLPSAFVASASSATFSGGAGTAIVGNLNAVSCTSSSSCTAVGNTAANAGSPSETALGGPLIEHYNGSRWSSQSGANPAAVAPLGAIACVSSTYCVAGGYYETKEGFEYAFAEGIGHGGWRSVPIATPHGAVVAISGMSCVSATWCALIGDTGISISAPEYGFTEIFNGVRWAGVSESRNAGMNALSCPTKDFCVAVGNNFAVNSSPIEIYNGRQWSFVSSPVTGGYVYLNGVSCVSAKFCVAVGAYGLGNVGSFIEVFNGSRWTSVAHPGPASYLRSVSCVSVVSCVAVGNLGSSLDNSSPSIAEVFNGQTWKVTPNPIPKDGVTLGGVSCTSPSFCIAVGNRGPSVSDAGTSRGLIERYDGSKWTVSQS
jgi:hypothetical protein